MSALIKKFQRIPIEIYSALIGLIFILVIFGAKNVDPLNTDWVLYGGGDNFQHYIGWRFFREANWTRFFLFMPNLNYPVGSSVIVTDSNPLFSLFFKLFRGILPKVFQFNGLWLLSCYALIGFFSGLIGKKLNLNNWQTLVFTGFALLNPVVIQRAAIHDTLAGHWLMLAAIWLVLKPDWKFNPAGWGFLCLLAMLIHIYFLPMILFLFGIQTILSCRTHLRQNLLTGLICVIVILLGYFGLGYQYIKPSGGSYGELSMNLNAFINPDGASALIGNRLTFPLQYEGFNYFGLGLLLLLIVGAFPGLFQSPKHTFFLTIYSLVFLLFALSNVVTWDKKVILTIHLPAVAEKILSTFRSSGRFAWPFYYLALVFAMSSLQQFSMKFSPNRKKVISGIILGLFMLQVLDLTPWFLAYYDRFHTPPARSSILSVSDWSDLIGQTAHVAVSDGDASLIDKFALLAVNQSKTFNSGANARSIKPVFGGDNLPIEFLLAQDMLPTDTLYILLNDSAAALAEGKYPNQVSELGNIKYLLVRQDPRH